jgi:hypothetical protein
LSEAERRITNMPRSEDPADIARWAYFNANRRHRQLVQMPIRIHSAPLDSASWEPVQKEADDLVRRILLDLGDPELFSRHSAADYSSAANAPKYLPLRLVTPVWGKEYSETFVNVTLPTILSLGNVPAIPNKDQCSYTIYTDAVGREIIERSSAYAILREYLRTEVRLLKEDVANRYVASSNCYREIVEEAARESAAAVFLIPDMILADGSIRFIANILRSGKRQILITGIRLIKETAVPALLRDYAAGGVLSITAPELIRLAMGHIHPITETHLFEGDSEYFHPAGMYWRVGEEGFVLRCFHLHPVAVVPHAGSGQFSGTIDDDLMESAAKYDKDVYVVTDSDEIQWCEVSRVGRMVPTPQRTGMQGILDWMDNNTSAFHRALVNSTIRVHTGSFAGPAWEAAEAKAEASVRDILARHELRVTERLEENARLERAALAAQAPKTAGMLLLAIPKLGWRFVLALFSALRTLVIELIGIVWALSTIVAQFMLLAERRLRKPILGEEFPLSLLYFSVAAVTALVLLPLRLVFHLIRRRPEPK